MYNTLVLHQLFNYMALKAMCKCSILLTLDYSPRPGTSMGCPILSPQCIAKDAHITVTLKGIVRAEIGIQPFGIKLDISVCVGSKANGVASVAMREMRSRKCGDVS